METVELETLSGFVGGFTLGAWECAEGYRQFVLGDKDGGKTTGTLIHELPKNISWGGLTYTLEDVEVGANGFVNAHYV